MKRRLKQSLSLLLAFCLLLSAAPLAGLAEIDWRLPTLSNLFSQVSHAAEIVDSGYCGDDVTWTLDNNGLLTISGTGEMNNYSDHYAGENYYITTAPWGGSISNCKRIKTVVIKSGVTSIGQDAFLGCIDLTSVMIENGVMSIGETVFSGCTDLTSVTIPDSVTSIGYYAFSDCTGLTSMTIPNSVKSIETGAFNNTAWYNAQPDGLVYAGKVVYEYKGTMPYNTVINIKAGTLGIAGHAFYECTGLTNVIIPDSVESIGQYAFYRCTGLTSVTIPDSVTSIGESAFRLCTGLTNVMIGNSVKSIEDYAFEDCMGLTSVTIPDSVERIGAGAFSGCSGLTSVTIPDSVTSIGSSVFSRTAWYNAQPDGLVYAEKVALEYKGTMPANTMINIKAGTLCIADFAFDNCTGLTSVTIPDSVTSIGLGALENCTSLTSVTIPDGVMQIGAQAFYGCSGLTSVTIGSSVTSIGDFAFSRCTGLTSVTIPDSVTSIGGSAFSECNGLTSVTIPDSVTRIGGSAFWLCEKLTGITIPNNVTKIEMATLEGCSRLKNVTIPDSVTIIGDYAFEDCMGLSSVTIPDSVTRIGESAFYKCNNLSDVYYAGSESDWTKMAIAEGNTSLTSATIHYNSTGPVNTYIVSYNANSGADVPENQTKTEGKVLMLSGTIPTKSYALTYNANGGSVSSGSKTVNATFKNWNTQQDGFGTTYNPGAAYSADEDVTLYAQWTDPKAGDLPVPTRSDYTFDGWFTAANGGTLVNEDSTVTKSQTLYAHWTPLPTYTVAYNANGGSGAPKNQTKTEGKALTLSSAIPAKSYTLTFNANGGSVSSGGKTVYAAFRYWNTRHDAAGATYYPGESYFVDADVTLYAQWANPAAGSLPVPTRSGYTFLGWYTGKNGGMRITEAGEVTETRTLYAHWKEIPKNTYVVSYDANGGKGTPSDQMKTEGKPLTISSFSPAKSFKLTYNANGGSVSTDSKNVSAAFRNWNTAKDGSGATYYAGGTYYKDANVTLYAQWLNQTAGALAVPARAGYTFAGWYTSASGGTEITGDTVIDRSQTLYAQWKAIPKNTYVVSYDANGGSGAPVDQMKTEGKTLTLSGVKPAKSYTLFFNANGGGDFFSAKPLNAGFKKWNTKRDGSGTSYAPGASYAKNASVTLYAQWSNPKAGDLVAPTRSGYTFEGWYTAAVGGIKITKDSVITRSQTLYAHWKPIPQTNLYSLGEETYGFVNFGDDDAPVGHCHGMAITSAGYYLGILDVSKIGLRSPQGLYSAKKTDTVTDPICYFQSIQGDYLEKAIVAGNVGSISDQWKSAVNYVRNHAFDGKGALTITIRTYIGGIQYGHALTFLRYENVKGQDRIYAYDSETPGFETYFYLTSAGIRQAPEKAAYAPFPINFKFALNDVAAFFKNAERYKRDNAIYARPGEVSVFGAQSTTMLGKVGEAQWIMYELPDNAEEVIVIPQTDDATFTYQDREYSFDEPAHNTYATLSFAEAGAGKTEQAAFKVHDGNAIDYLGDVDGNKEVNSDDARLALRAAVGAESYKEGSKKFLAADADLNGKLAAADARLILRNAIGLIDLPAAYEDNTSPAGQITLTYDGNKNISIDAVDMVGMKSFDFVIKTDDGIVLKKIKASADAPAGVAAGNPLTTEYNKSNGRFSGYFKDALWTLDRWQAAAHEVKEKLPADFDPNNFNLGTIEIDASAAEEGDCVFISGTVNGEKRIDARVQLIQDAGELLLSANVSAQDCVDVSVRLNNVKWLTDAGFEINYDPTVFSYVDYDKGTDVDKDMAVTIDPSENGKIIVSTRWWNGSTKTVFDLLHIRLRINDGASPDGAVIQAIVSSNDGMDLRSTQSTVFSVPPIDDRPVVMPGDVSGDGLVTAEDARLALRAAVGLEDYAEGSAEFLAADASKDGAITSEDARLILRAAVGLETLS